MKIQHGWRDIPGYNGRYQINTDGDIRTVFANGKEHMMRCRPNHHRHDGAVTVQLTTPEGKNRTEKVLQLVVRTFLGGNRPGLVPYHMDGNKLNNAVYNIGFTTQSEIGKKFGGIYKRKPVCKIDMNGDVIETYGSATDAAADNFCDKAAVLSRCHGRIDNPFAGTGYSFKFADDVY